ncbi:MAG TPA: hypothetical protein VJP02_24320 [Candidatus Sulfotelmatobacter sp.]|nr:hypothetical protein [Candidatus Sulfotelmatobacter sp.]
MKRLTVVSGICASFLLGTAMTAVAQGQDEHRNDRQDQARPEDRRNQEPQSGDRKNTTPQSEQRQNQEPQSGDRHPQSRENDRQRQDRQQQDRGQQGRQQQPRQDRNEPGREVNGGRQDQARPEGQARGAEPGRAERREGNQRRIPDSDFHAHFGREHHFAPGRMQVYNGQPQFYYGGYNFVLIQAWPEDWSYDADDYYIDEFDGEYWLFNLENPGVRLELMIVD